MPLYALDDLAPTLPDGASVFIAPGAHVIGDVTLGAEPGRPYRLELDPEATEAQKYRLISWIGQ